MKNYYEILEVNEKASKEVIEKAYKVLVKKYHPDFYTGAKRIYAEKKIKEINEAYDVLADDFMKEQYDNELKKLENGEMNQGYNTNVEPNVNNNTNNNINVNNNFSSEQPNQKIHTNMKKSKVGTFSGIVELCRELYSNRPEKREIKKITKKDVIAVILTIIVAILIGIILWFIPFTNGWMRELLFENPIFNWIGSLFS